MVLPDGVVTFLFTDVEGSTHMWEESPDLMMKALEQHDQAIDKAVADNNGVSVKPRGEGDSRFVVFQGAHDAVAATAANNTPGIDFRLERAGVIMGHVYESDAVTPIANLRVYALDFTTDQWMATTNTLPVSSSTIRTIL